MPDMPGDIEPAGKQKNRSRTGEQRPASQRQETDPRPRSHAHERQNRKKVTWIARERNRDEGISQGEKKHPADWLVADGCNERERKRHEIDGRDGRLPVECFAPKHEVPGKRQNR
jgi:hypothetical protein